MIQRSEDTSIIAPLLMAAHREFEPAVKDSTNPHHKSTYTSYRAVMDAVREPLHSRDLFILHGTDGDGTVVTVHTQIFHVGGQWIGTSLTMKPTQAGPQGIGSCVTYGRRYGLAALCALCVADDDGEEASRPMVAAKATRPAKAEKDGQAEIDYGSVLKVTDTIIKMAGALDANGEGQWRRLVAQSMALPAVLDNGVVEEQLALTKRALKDARVKHGWKI